MSHGWKTTGSGPNPEKGSPLTLGRSFLLFEVSVLSSISKDLEYIMFKYVPSLPSIHNLSME